MPNQSGSSVFLEVGSTIVGEKELAKLREDSKELAEISAAMKNVKVEEAPVEDDAPAPIETDDMPRGWR